MPRNSGSVDASVNPGVNIFILTRRSLLLLGTGALLICFALRELKVGAPPEYLPHLLQVTIFPWAVFAIALWRLSRSGDEAVASGTDFAALLLIAMISIPLAGDVSRSGIGLATGAMGAFVLWRSRNDCELRAGAVCLLALCTNLSIAPLIFRLGYGHFIGVDMYLLQTAIDFVGAPVVATPAGLVAADGLRVMLVGACSSFMGISAAVLVHMGWAMAIRTEVGWRDAAAVAATVCVATLLNIIRLTLTASGHDAYEFWHGAIGETPLGGQIFWFAQNLVLLTGGYVSATWAARPAPRTAIA
jgi:hypothetical protein